MRRVRLSVGTGPILTAWVAETSMERAVGLQIVRGLRDDQGMYFLLTPPDPARFSMMSVTFPIDMIFFRSGRVLQIVSSIPPGHPGTWEISDGSGMLEVRGGWAHDYNIMVGDPIFMSNAL